MIAIEPAKPSIPSIRLNELIIIINTKIVNTYDAINGNSSINKMP